MLNSVYFWLCNVINVLLAVIFAIAMIAVIIIAILGAYYLVKMSISWLHENDNSEVADDKRKINR